MASHKPVIVAVPVSEDEAEMKLVCRCGWVDSIADVVDPLEALIKSQVHQGEQRGLT